MLGGGLNYLGSCSKGRSMLRHIAQSLFGESGDHGVFRKEMGDINLNMDLKGDELNNDTLSNAVAFASFFH